MRKVALNISKDVKKFWIKIEKLASSLSIIWILVSSDHILCPEISNFHIITLRLQVLYKHQLELDEKTKKALDKQLEFLLGQTERYSCFHEVIPSLWCIGRVFNVIFLLVMQVSSKAVGYLFNLC